jgi:predicted Zn-dependent protease
MGGAARQDPVARWINDHGGEMDGDRAQRLAVVCQSLRPAVDRPISVHVLNMDSACAFSWPDGRIYVSRGLIDCVDDSELAAALAHEMGHLLADGKMKSVVALGGCYGSGNMDCESRADDIGVQLLAARGIRRDAMASLLTKVAASPGVSPVTRQSIQNRVRRISESS